MKMDFNNKVVIITGASSGIGASSALHFAKSSAKLALVGRNAENLDKTSISCQKYHGDVPLKIIADLSVDEDVKRIVDDTLTHYGRIDVLINNAGAYHTVGVLNPIEVFDRTMTTNLRGTYLLSTLALPHLIKTKGNIVNISSVCSFEPVANLTAYCMSKAALDMFTKCAAQQYGPQGVRVNSINPGPVKTEIFKTAGMTADENDAFFGLAAELLPLKKVAIGEDVAELVIYLASDKASCITGSCHVIDCGGSVVNKYNIL